MTNNNSHLISHVSPISVQTTLYDQPHSSKIKDDINLYHQTGILNRNIVPPLNWVHPASMMGVKRPELNALHQAHLRSPYLVPAVLLPRTKKENSVFKYYQAIKDFALYPSILSLCSILNFEFSVSEAEIIKIPLDSISCNGSICSREFQQGTLQYRLRCVEISSSETSILGNEWMVKDTTWPENICLDINSRHLEIRRKIHHGKDLPIDITQHVLKNGIDSPNRVTVSIIQDRNKVEVHNYFLAVEVIEILEHSQILDMCQKTNRLPVSHTLEMIKKSLAPSLIDKDDGFEMVISHISINLADPFTTRTFEIPVRGKYCLHRECFDLETYLNTRISKPNRKNQPCMVDVWKCPLCGNDARPWQLQIDGYLESIRTELVEQGNLDVVKSIRVEPDGKWYPKIEKRKSFTSSIEQNSLNNDSNTSLQESLKFKRPIEVIVLEDD
ncbi:putative miz zinc finger domain protein [Erysiphe necator]|uniref:Putative miz zinc finger domain protein n=1 Tax=Uncinula necator TaxID=52586 RepID=A0A0B1P7J9_UNCNE|nr:putative miz zinc finger domain protein [Erysiphe necator]